MSRGGRIVLPPVSTGGGGRGVGVGVGGGRVGGGGGGGARGGGGGGGDTSLLLLRPPLFSFSSSSPSPIVNNAHISSPTSHVFNPIYNPNNDSIIMRGMGLPGVSPF